MIMPSSYEPDYTVVHGFVDWAKWFGQLYLTRSIAPHLMKVFNEHGKVFRTYY